MDRTRNFNTFLDMSVNTTYLMGRVGKDPKVRTVGQSNSKVAQFSLCTGGKYQTKDGREVDDTAWHNVVAWSRLAELAEKYIRKGSQVLIIGHINYRKYTGNDNVERSVTDIIADKIELCSAKPESQSPAPQQASQPTYQNNYGTTPMPYPTDEGPIDDLPF